MPYIKPEFRPQFDDVLDKLPEFSCKGDLEYCLFRLLLQFMSTRDRKYSTLHEAVYAASHVADEFRRRFLDVREDEAREANGDVAVS